MPQTALLNAIDHGGLRVAIRHGAAFGDAVNQMLVVPTELVEASREFPILFRSDGDAWTAVALLGFDRDENLFLDGERWTSRYVPAVQRRGPCLIGGDPAADPKIMIALDDPRVGDPEGAPLFLPHGGHAPALEQLRDALEQLHAGVGAAPAVYAAFDQAGLLREVVLEIEIDEDSRYTIGGYWAVAQEALAALDPAALARLNADGALALAFAAAQSLGNVQHLIARKRAARQG